MGAEAARPSDGESEDESEGEREKEPERGAREAPRERRHATPSMLAPSLLAIRAGTRLTVYRALQVACAFSENYFTKMRKSRSSFHGF